MEPEEYETMYRLEDTHWWYLGMRSITQALLRRWYGSESRLTVLDVGCGTGAAMTGYLAEFGKVTGVDLSGPALAYCQRRRAERLACASGVSLPFQAQSFDLVTSFDVLYERGIPSDEEAVTEAFRVLRPGGRFVLRLPAYDWLRSRHDEAVHTARRYTAGRVSSLLRGAGFRLLYLTYANTLLFPLALVMRLAERVLPARSPSSDLRTHGAWLNRLLAAVLSAETALLPHGRLPFGLSVLAVGQKSPL